MNPEAVTAPTGSACARATIAVDLTPWPSLANNGVDGAVVRVWLKAAIDLDGPWQWILLTSPENHEFFASLESPQARRRCTDDLGLRDRMALDRRPLAATFWRRTAKGIRLVLGLPLPPRPQNHGSLLRQLQADLMFCPLGGSNFADVAVPTIALWNNLAHLHYPQFLRPHEQAAADLAFRETVGQADKLVCFSPRVRAEIIDQAKIDGQRVGCLEVEPFEPLPPQSAASVATTLSKFDLTLGRYLLHLAEFTAANNHKLLLVAFAMFRAQHPETNLKMAFVGSRGPGEADLRLALRTMDLANHVVFIPVDAPHQHAALLQGCLALIWPTLEPTYTRLLHQAILFGKPLLCSSFAGLPQSIRSSAHSFDAKKPKEMVSLLNRLSSDVRWIAALTERSHSQASNLPELSVAANGLLGLFQEVLNSSRQLTTALKGIYPDGWTGERMLISVAPSPEPRNLRLTLQAPRWLPWSFQRIRLLRNQFPAGKIHKLKRGKALVVELALPCEGARLEVVIDPPLVPKALGLNEDARLLGCICTECAIRTLAGTVNLHESIAA